MDTRTALARALTLRKRTLSLEWLRQLEGGRAVPSEAGGTPAALPDGVPQVIEWIATGLEDAAPPADLTDALRPLVRLRRQQGRTPRELILEFRLLGRILADALVAEIETTHRELPPDRAGRIASELADRVLEVLGEASALRAEEDRTAEGVAGLKLEDHSRMVTHDLIDSLTAAELAAEALLFLDFGADPRQREIAKRVQAGLRDVGRVVESVRLLTLPDGEAVGGGGAPDREALEPVGRVVRRAIDRSLAAAAGAGAAGTDIEVEKPLPELEVDASRLEPLLRNLLASALVFPNPTVGEKSNRSLRLRVVVETNQLEIRCARGAGEEGAFSLSLPASAARGVPAG